MDDRVGTLEPGKEADVLVVRGNPAHEINDLWNVADVYFAGQKLERGSEESQAAVQADSGPSLNTLNQDISETGYARRQRCNSRYSRPPAWLTATEAQRLNRPRYCSKATQFGR